MDRRGTMTDGVLSLRVLGCSGSFAGPGTACSGYLVRSDSTTVWVDCGPGTLATLQQHVALADIDAIVVSHEHPDHCADLPVFYNAAKYYAGLASIPVVATAGVRAVVDAFQPYGDSSDLFGWDIVSDGEVRVIGDLTFRFSRTDHPVETLACRVDGHGRSITYTSDTGPGWSLAALGDSPDLVVGEGTLLASNANDGSPHLTCWWLGNDARAVGAGHLVVTHVPPGGDVEAHRLEAAEAFGGLTSAAVGGACYTL